MNNDLFNIMKAKLARGGQMNGGEIKLIVLDLVNLYAAQQEKINELETQLNAIAKRGSKRAPKSAEATNL